MSNLTFDFDGSEDIKKEFSINFQTGQGFVTIRGLARLSGVTRQAIQQLLSSIAQGKPSLSKIFKSFAGQDFTGGKPIPDTLASLIIKHYAYKGYEVSQQTDLVLGALGLRSYIQESLSWKQKTVYTKAIPSEWQLRFEKPFYAHLSRLTGLKQKGHHRPIY